MVSLPRQAKKHMNPRSTGRRSTRPPLRRERKTPQVISPKAEVARNDPALHAIATTTSGIKRRLRRNAYAPSAIVAANAMVFSRANRRRVPISDTRNTSINRVAGMYCSGGNDPTEELIPVSSSPHSVNLSLRRQLNAWCTPSIKMFVSPVYRYPSGPASTHIRTTQVASPRAPIINIHSAALRRASAGASLTAASATRLNRRFAVADSRGASW